MIVNNTKNGYEIILHYAHALQAGQIAQYIKAEHRPAYWLETLCAIITHDDCQVNFERNNNVTKAGVPCDFKLIESDPKGIIERCVRVVERSRHRSGWVTLMILHHLDFIYQDLKESYAPLKKYLNGFMALRNNVRKQYGVTKKQAAASYELLRFCDRISLIVAQNQVPDGGRKLEINKSINEKTYYITSDEGINIISPWPFEVSQFTICTEVYQVEQITFKNSTELQEHLMHLQPILRAFKFKN